ncbi:MAG: hypothetical protein U9N02_06545 [Campylobacterota bacterium]|nr:hypothetical protein [Campylobacterota bacterium]
MKNNKLNIIVLYYIFFSFQLNAIEMEDLAQSLNLSAGSKAIVQWKRVFKSEKKMKRYKIDRLNIDVRKRLEEYLIEHAIDSDKPIVAGGF